jgi:hypothetical protein
MEPLGMGRTAAGIIAPLTAIDAQTKREPQAGTGATDPDGRRRVVLTREDRKLVDATVAIFQRTGKAFVLICAQRPAVDSETGRPASPKFTSCGEVMRREGDGTDDQGFGCSCTRIHFEPKPVSNGRRR